MKRDKEKGDVKSWLNAASIGISFVTAIAIGTLIGYYLDKRFGTKPYFTLFFMIMGIAAGFKNMFYFLKRTGIFKKDDEKD